MQDNKNSGKTNQKILLSSTMKILTSILIATVLAVGTYAWFTANRTVKETNLNMSLYEETTTLDYEVYKFNEAIQRGILFDNPGIKGIDLTEYDLILQNRNRYTPAFAKLVVTRDQEMDDSGTLNITVFRNINPTKPESAREADDFSSSIMRYTAIIDSATEESDYEGDTSYRELIKTNGSYSDWLYRHVDNALYGPDATLINVIGLNGDHENETHNNKSVSSKIFVYTDEQGNIQKYNSITLPLNYKSTDWYGENNNKMNVYLYISYDSDLVDSYSWGSITLGTPTVNFYNDIVYVKFEYESNNET